MREQIFILNHDFLFFAKSSNSFFLGRRNSQTEKRPCLQHIDRIYRTLEYVPGDS